MAYPTMSGPGFDTDPSDASIFSVILNWSGAIMSLGLVLGLVWWAYDIATRDAREVPVIRAMEGPARVAPDEPGGFRAPHKGYAVNAIAGDDSREPVAETVALAPAPAAVEESDAPAMRPGMPPPEDVIRNSVDRALMDALGTDAAPTSDAASAQETGVPRRPRPRPEGRAEVSRALPTEPLPLVAVSASPSEVAPLVPRDIPPGTRLVQLGAFSTEAAAQTEWRELSAGFAEYFDDKRPVFEQTEASGVALWRLRAHGFEDRAAARRFCEVLLARQVECIPVLTR